MSTKKTHVTTMEEQKAKLAAMASIDRRFQEAIAKGIANRKKKKAEDKK